MALLGMMVLLASAAIAVDVALLALEANSTQRACDASALAAVTKLQTLKTGSTYSNTPNSQKKAIDEAVFIGAQNGVVIKPEWITFPQAGKIRVKVAVNSTLYLARIWGINPTTMTRSATAEKSTLKGISKAAPLGISASDYKLWSDGSATFSVKLARNTSEAFSSGNVLALSFDQNVNSKPVAIFEKEVREGCVDQVLVDQWVNSLNAATAQQNALLDAMNARLAAGQSVFPIVILPDKAANVGTSKHKVQTIAMIRVFSTATIKPEEGEGTNLERTQLMVRFLPEYTVGSQTQKFTIGNPGVSTIRALRLVDDL